jgi:ABC-type polysaccharide/polyol phosphate export permease
MRRGRRGRTHTRLQNAGKQAIAAPGGTMATNAIETGMGEAVVDSTLKGMTAAGLEEIIGGIRHWRVWHLLGVRELRHRYARSKLGQLWLTFSTAAMIAVISGVWSLLWNQSLPAIVPFFGVSVIMWTYLSQVLLECTAVFVNHGNLYRNQKMNFSVSIYSVIYRQTLMLAHSVIIIMALVIGFGVPVNWNLLQLIPGLLLTWIAMLWLGYIVAMACVRYRDIIQVITTWLMVLFFITPVMWKPDFLPAKYRFIVDINPWAQFLELLRNPLLGEPVSGYTWAFTCAIALGGGLLALPLIGRYQRRIIFWM